MTSYINDRGKTPSTGDVVGPASATDNAVARFDGTGGKTLQNSSFVVDDSGHVTSFGGQIAFPATQAASAGANVLDDYEEGTFTPTDVSGASLSFSAASGAYVKIGNFVQYRINVSYPTTADVNTAKISVPFTAGAGDNQTTCSVVSNVTTAVNALCNQSAAQVSFYPDTSTTAYTNVGLTGKSLFFGVQQLL